MPRIITLRKVESLRFFGWGKLSGLPRFVHEFPPQVTASAALWMHWLRQANHPMENCRADGLKVGDLVDIQHDPYADIGKDDKWRHAYACVRLQTTSLVEPTTMVCVTFHNAKPVLWPKDHLLQIIRPTEEELAEYESQNGPLGTDEALVREALSQQPPAKAKEEGPALPPAKDFYADEATP